MTTIINHTSARAAKIRPPWKKTTRTTRTRRSKTITTIKIRTEIAATRTIKTAARTTSNRKTPKQ